MADEFLTNVPAEFASILRPGDIVLFDSLSMVAGSTQWGDQSPYNHCSLVLDNDYLVEANRTEPSGLRMSEVPGPTSPAIRTKLISDRLAMPHIATITLLRHVNVSIETSVEKLIEIAKAAIGKHAFSVLDLALIGQERFLINYADREWRDEHKLLWRWMTLMSKLAIEQVGDGTRSISCSEFVYRCFTECGEPNLGLPRTTIPLVETTTLANSAEAKDLFDLWAPLEDKEGAGRDDGPFRRDSGLQDADRCAPGDFARSTDFERVAVLTHHLPLALPHYDRRRSSDSLDL